MAERKQPTKRRGWIIFSIVLIASNVGTLWYFLWLRPSVPVENSPLQISDVTGANRTNYLGKIVTVDGYIVRLPSNRSILVASYNLLRVNRILLPTEFVTINNTLPEEIANQTGDRLWLKGVVGIDDGNSNVTRLSYLSHKIVEQSGSNYAEWVMPVNVLLPPAAQPQRYAVLMSGGWDGDDAFLRYWNDLSFMDALLEAFYNYSRSNIYVLYKDGNPEGPGMAVNYSCTYANIQAVFTALQAKMTDADQLFIYTTNHGVNVGLCLWNKDILLPSDLETILSPLHYNRLIVVMEQCYSGVFVNHLSGARRVIITACTADQNSYGASTAIPFDEFTYHFMDAARQMTILADPIGSDYNKDGKVSMVEAFNYAQSTDAAPETPQFDDDGNGLSHSGWMPAGGDGVLGGIGDTTFL
ncbi:MAG TPA: C13 family peptidase [Candidatus Lokiarchaeia archaeon]|nr:C13 family peptidase [Candidatus Lokiarchaeia archaeon]